MRLALAVRTSGASLENRYPSECWRSRCSGGKLAINPTHTDFPALTAEALDVLACCDWDDRQAAVLLGISRTQLIRFLKLEPAALAVLNTHREASGLSPLK